MIGIKMSMPDECHKCHFYLGGFVCSLTLDITPIEDRPEWCPLISLQKWERMIMIALDRPMPKSCEDCPCFHDAACCAEGFRNSTTLDWFERQERREDWCPLIDLTDDEK